MSNLCLNRVMFSSNVVFEDFVLRSLDASPLLKPVLESFCRFEVRVHFKNRFFFSNLWQIRQVYSVVSKQEEQAHSSFPAILFRMKSFAHMPRRWNTQNSGIDIIYINYT